MSSNSLRVSTDRGICAGMIAPRRSNCEIARTFGRPLRWFSNIAGRERDSGNHVHASILSVKKLSVMHGQLFCAAPRVSCVKGSPKLDMAPVESEKGMLAAGDERMEVQRLVDGIDQHRSAGRLGNGRMPVRALHWRLAGRIRRD